MNERKSPRIVLESENNNQLVEINSKEDIIRWDGKGNILLKIDIKRGEETMLQEYVPLLKTAGARVYVEFGILSHPAIMLREMGINVFPLYSMHHEYSL